MAMNQQSLDVPNLDMVEFVMSRLSTELRKANKTMQPRTVVYALDGTWLSHPDYNGGDTFQVDRDRVIEWLSGATGGGKAIFKIYASLEAHRFGSISKPTRKLFEQAGFSLAMVDKAGKE